MEFDFAKHRVRIGPIWKDSVANVHGGEALSRASTVNTVERKLSDGNWNINPNLDFNHRNIIKNCLKIRNIFLRKTQSALLS